MISTKQVKKLFSKPTKDMEEFQELYLALALEISKKTRPNDLSREALILLKESMDKLQASIALDSEEEPY